jgi:Fe-S-cluster containining protein
MNCDGCHAMCCEVYTFTEPDGEDQTRFFEYHGWKVNKRDDGMVDVVVPSPCKHLQRNAKGEGHCAIYIHRPAICRKWQCGRS